MANFWESTGGGAAIEGIGGLASGLISLFGPDPAKKEHKYWEKRKTSKLADIQKLLKPNAPWVNIAQNLPAMNTAMNNQVNRGLSLYRGGATGTEAPPVAPMYPWMG